MVLCSKHLDLNRGFRHRTAKETTVRRNVFSTPTNSSELFQFGQRDRSVIIRLQCPKSSFVCWSSTIRSRRPIKERLESLESLDSIVDWGYIPYYIPFKEMSSGICFLFFVFFFPDRPIWKRKQTK